MSVVYLNNAMRAKLLAFAGLALFGFSVVYNSYYPKEVSRLIALDYYPDSFVAIQPESNCVIVEEPVLSRRMVAEQEAVVLKLTLIPNTEFCQADIQAPGFTVLPSETKYSFDKQKIDKKVDVTWTLTPTRSGTFDIPVTVDFYAKVLHLEVTNVFGLNPWQAQLLAGVGVFMGPAMSLPWWIERFNQRKLGQKKENQP